MVGCTVPIQQSGMGSIANPELAGAVSEAGALGMVSVGGFPSEKIIEEFTLIKKYTVKPFGANFLIPNIAYEDLSEIHESVETAAKFARIIDFFYNEPDASLVKIVHSEHGLVSWQVGSKQEALAAVDAGCDFIVAQGIEAGGHIRGRIGLFALLDQILSAIDVPVVAAGGIGSGRTMAAALAAGASAVRIGTRLVGALEANAHPVYQEALIKAEAQDTIHVTDGFSVGWPDAPHRVLRSSLEAARAFDGDQVGERYLKMDNQWAPVKKLQPIGISKEVKGHIEAMSMWAGEGVGNVKKIQPVRTIIRELNDEAERLLRHWT